MRITLYHHSGCSNSRGALALIRQAGFEPVIVEYLLNPPDRDTLRQLASASGLGVRGLLRSKEPLHAELALDNPALDDEALLGAMLAHPVLINRPLVQSPKGVRLCRPPELVLPLLAD